MSIERLLRPRSIAIVGASETVGPGFNAWKALEFVGFKGDVHLVNPNKPEIFGHPTFRSLADIPGEVDAAFISVQAERVVEIAAQAAAKKVGGLAILSSGFGEAGDEGALAEQKLAQLAEAHGMAVCGPNCLGLLNFAGGTALFGTSLPERVARGGVAAIVQSGSIGIALLNAARGFGLSYLITSGNEAVTTAADYLEAILEDPVVETVIIFAEQIRKPQKFIATIRRARELGKPVIVLKSGRSVKAQAAVRAHTGAVAGSVEACDAALAAAGAIQVFSLDELVETAVLVSRISARPSKSGIGALSLSGGEIALALDAAEAVGAELAAVEPVKDGLAGLLPKFAHISNPLDLTWAGLYDPEVARGCARTMGGHGDVGTLVLLQDAPHGLGPQQAGRYSRLLTAVAAGAKDAGKPLVAISNLSGEPHPELAAAAEAASVPYLRGTQEGLTAVARYARWATAKGAQSGPARDPRARARAQALLAGIPVSQLPTEYQARQVLAAYGLSGPREQIATSPEEAAAAATQIGFPAVLKGLVPGIVHKSDAGLVTVGLKSTADVLREARRMADAARRLQPNQAIQFLVQQQAQPVAELLVGARVDPDFGPLIVAGSGGVLVEVYKDVAVRLAPIGPAEALEALHTTRVARTLTGFRGRPPGDLQAVAQAVSALSHFIADFSANVSEVEINPLAVLAEGQGCRMLDCVIIPQQQNKHSSAA